MKESATSKILKSVIAKEGIRPILECVHYANGDAVATDSHQLVRFNNVFENKDFEATINILSVLPSSLKYPDVTRVIPKEFNLSASFSTDIVKDLVKFLKVVKKEVIIMNLTNANSIDISVQNSGMKYSIPTYTKVSDPSNAPKQVALAAQYLLHALQYIPDLIRENKAAGDIVIEFTKELQPLKLTFDNMEFVISPTRLRH